MKTLAFLVASSLSVSAMAAPSHLLIGMAEYGYSLGSNTENTDFSALYKLPISTAWMDQLVVDKRGGTGLVCRVVLRHDNSNLLFMVSVQKTEDSRFMIHAFGSGSLKVGDESSQYRNGTATSTSVFRTVADFDFSQQVSFTNATHGKNVEISVKASEDSTLLGKAKSVQVTGKDRKVLVEGSESDAVSCSIQ